MPATRTTRRTAAQRAEDLRLRDALKAGWSEKELVAIGFEIAGAAKPDPQVANEEEPHAGGTEDSGGDPRRIG
jgi:hypothetical protein